MRNVKHVEKLKMERYKLDFNAASGSDLLVAHPEGEYVKYEDHLKEVDRLMSEDNPSGDALDWIWRDIVLKYRPNYGDWEYPAQAYRHIVAEYEELRTMYAQLKKELDEVNIRRMNPNHESKGKTFVSFMRSESEIVGNNQSPPRSKPAPANVYISEGSQRVVPPSSCSPDAGFTTKGG